MAREHPTPPSPHREAMLREPRRYRFVAAEGPPTTDLLFLSLDREEAGWLMRRIADDLIEDDEIVSVALCGWLEDEGAR